MQCVCRHIHGYTCLYLRVRVRIHHIHSQVYTHVCYAQVCLTLCDPMDYGQPDSSVHGIFQARILEWVAISYSKGFSWPRDRTQVSWVSHIGRWFFTTAPHTHMHVSLDHSAWSITSWTGDKTRTSNICMPRQTLETNCVSLHDTSCNAKWSYQHLMETVRRLILRNFLWAGDSKLWCINSSHHCDFRCLKCHCLSL